MRILANLSRLLGRAVRSFVLGTALSIGIASPALALCSEANMADDFKQADYVVKARVVAETFVADDEPSPEWIARWGDYSPVTLHRLRVSQVFKGRPGATVEFFNEVSSGRFGLSLGEDYLLFLHRYGAGDPRPVARSAVYVKHTCGPSMLWKDIKVEAAEELRRLSSSLR